MEGESNCLASNNDNDPTTKEKGLLYSIKRNEEFGRYVVAATDISRKSQILLEDPVMCAPWPIDDKVTFEEPLCLGCCRHMKTGTRNNTEDDNPEETCTDNKNRPTLPSPSPVPHLSLVKRCSKCNWPVCSPACEELFQHKDNECLLFQENKLPYPPPGDYVNIVTTSVMIQLIRCLLVKQHNPSLFSDSILSLQSQTALGTRPWNFDLMLDDIQLIFPLLESELSSREECCRILSIININAFSNTFNENAEFAGCAICLFLQASMIAHSCTPNCWWTLSEDPSHQIAIKASQNIKKDDVITVCYSNQYSTFGTAKRQQMFRTVGGFACKCPRCLDPSELGSFVSAVVCENCMSGYKNLASPTDSQSKWKCDRCGHLESPEFVEGLVNALESRLRSCLGKVSLLVRFLQNSKTVLHNNHWIVTQAEDAIMKEWAKDPDLRYRGSCAQEIVITCEYFISLCFHVLSVRNVTSPGLSFHRVRYLLFYARARMARLEFLVFMLEDQNLVSHFLSNNSSSSVGGRNAQSDLDSEIQSLRQEYHEILELYHEVIEYRQMSGVSDAEIKCEIEHLIHLMKPIVQMEPHPKRPSTGDNNGAGDTGCVLS